MKDEIIKLIAENFGFSFVIGVTAISLVIFLSWWCRGMYDKIKIIENDINKNTTDNELFRNTINNHDGKIKDLENTISRIEASVEYMSKNIDIMMQTFFNNRFSATKNMFSMKKSPRVLNQEGETLFNNVKGKEFVDNHKAELFDIIDRMKPKTSLDVEQASITACLAISNTDVFSHIKDYIYNAPSLIIKEGDIEKKYDLSIVDVCFVISIYLRDIYLKEKFN